MSKTILFVILILLSCDAEPRRSTSASVHLASMFCGKRIPQMQWLMDLIQRSKSDPSLDGDIYAGRYEGQVVFIHQPVIMSCLACVIYDCDGNRLERATFDLEKLYPIVHEVNRIYTSPHR